MDHRWRIRSSMLHLSKTHHTQIQSPGTQVHSNNIVLCWRLARLVWCPWWLDLFNFLSVCSVSHSNHRAFWCLYDDILSTETANCHVTRAKCDEYGRTSSESTAESWSKDKEDELSADQHFSHLRNLVAAYEHFQLLCRLLQHLGEQWKDLCCVCSLSYDGNEFG